MPSSLTDKRRGLLLEISRALAGLTILTAAKRAHLSELSKHASKLSLPDDAAAEFREPMHETSDVIAIARGSYSIQLPAGTPAEVVDALFAIAVGLGLVAGSRTIDQLVAEVTARASRSCGYREHSIALHQVDSALRGQDDEMPMDPYPDGAPVSAVVYRACVVAGSLRATVIAYGKITGPPPTVGAGDRPRAKAVGATLEDA